MSPSQSKTRSPAFTSRGKGRKIVLTRVESPRIFAVVMTNGCPARSVTVPPPASAPVRILGPCRSTRMAMGFWKTAAASRNIAMLCACSACVPCEKFSRATSMPASRSLRIMWGERVAGPMVQTILEWRGFMLSSPLVYTSKMLLLDHAEFRDDARQQIDTPRKGGQRKALVVAVHSAVVLIGQGKRPQAIRLHAVKAELRGIGGPGGHGGEDRGASEFPRADSGDRGEELSLNRGIGSRKARIRRNLEVHQGIVHQFSELLQQRADCIPWQQTYI